MRFIRMNMPEGGQGAPSFNPLFMRFRYRTGTQARDEPRHRHFQSSLHEILETRRTRHLGIALLSILSS